VRPSRISVLCAEMQAGFINVATYGQPDSLTPQMVKSLVDKGKELVGMMHLAQRPIGHLSVGEQQRVAIVRCLAQGPMLRS
jgi:ABC-type Mn2+/Zn2+ transport system ATPase subunit